MPHLQEEYHIVNSSWSFVHWETWQLESLSQSIRGNTCSTIIYTFKIQTAFRYCGFCVNFCTNTYRIFLQVLCLHIVIMYNNIYYNLTYIATASAPYIYGLEKIPNEHECTKQEWRWPTSFGETRHRHNDSITLINNKNA